MNHFENIFQFRHEGEEPQFRYSEAKKWRQGMSGADFLCFSVIRRNLCEALGAKDFQELRNNLSEMEEGVEMEAVRTNFERLWVEQYGFKGSSLENRALVNRAMAITNEMIGYYIDEDSGILRRYHSSLSAISEISMEKNPLELLKIAFDGIEKPQSNRSRFEAARKMWIANHAMIIAIQELNNENDNSTIKLLDFLGNNVFESEVGGKPTPHHFVTVHDPEDYRCTEVIELNENTKTYVNDFRRYTEIYMREFRTLKGNLVPVMLIDREKKAASKLQKILRKGTEDIHDETGLRLVFKDERSVHHFINVLVQKAVRYGSILNISDISHSIGKKEASGAELNEHSSKDVNFAKAQIRFNGFNFELQMFTLTEYQDFMLRDGVDHAEYRIRQSMKLVPGLFPQYIYDYTFDLSSLKESLIRDVRSQKINRYHDLPPEYSIEGREYYRYTQQDFFKHVDQICKRVENSRLETEYVIAADAYSSLLASTLAQKLKAVPVFFDKSKPNQLLKIINGEVDKCLVVSNVDRSGQTIAACLKVLPQAKVAVLFSQNSEGLADFAGDRLDEKYWVNFPWLDDGNNMTTEQL